ncbi:MAG: F0F1 ATP synthase subunit B [Bacteroidales bacterium]|jgi:F-type H+-transporting ATPase subunit b|nr:F0F1 ATP synthase subunit B [Bacteroidales bacterium]
MSLLIPESGLFIWMLLAFGIVLFVLWKFGWPIFTKMLDDRAKYIDESIAKAKLANDELANIQAKTAAMLKEAQEQQSKILAEAVETRNQIVEKAKTEATMAGQKILAEAKQQIEVEKEDAIRDIRRQVGLLSVEISEKVLRQSLKTDKDQMAMIDRMLDELQTKN